MIDFPTVGAEKLTNAELQSAFDRANKKARKFEDKHGPLHYTSDRSRAVAFRWELTQRGLQPEGAGPFAH